MDGWGIDMTERQPDQRSRWAARHLRRFGFDGLIGGAAWGNERLSFPNVGYCTPQQRLLKGNDSQTPGAV